MKKNIGRCKEFVSLFKKKEYQEFCETLDEFFESKY